MVTGVVVAAGLAVALLTSSASAQVVLLHLQCRKFVVRLHLAVESSTFRTQRVGIVIIVPPVRQNLAYCSTRHHRARVGSYGLLLSYLFDGDYAICSGHRPEYSSWH